MKQFKRIAVVILNWNGEKHLKTFLPSVVEYSSAPNIDIIVADNGSTDESIMMLKNEFNTVKIIGLDKNYGFAGGYNKAIEQLSNEYIILLNSDVEVTPHWIDPVIDLMESNDLIVAAMPKIRAFKAKDNFEYAGAAGGFLDILAYPFCRGRILQNIESDHHQYDINSEVFWATGACMFIKNKAFKEAGGLDDKFFAHMEEIDLCWRLKNRGYKIMFCPDSIVYHLGGATLDYGNPRKTYLNFRNSLFTMHKNLSLFIFMRLMLLRFPLDMLAIAHLTYNKQFKAAFNIIKAYIDFINTKKVRDYYAQSMSQLTGVYRGSILLAYYSGIKTFAQLNMKKIK